MNKNPERIGRLEAVVTDMAAQIETLRRTAATANDVADRLEQIKTRFAQDEARASKEAQALWTRLTEAGAEISLLKDRVAALERRGFWRRLLRALSLWHEPQYVLVPEKDLNLK